MTDPDDTLSSPALPVRVEVDGIAIGNLSKVSEIVDLFNKAKGMTWVDELVVTDDLNRTVFMLRGIPFVRP